MAPAPRFVAGVTPGLIDAAEYKHVVLGLLS